MKKLIYPILIAILLTACASPTPLPTPIPTTAPTTPPEPTVTSTPAPVAVPMVYEGWTDNGYASVCNIYSTVTGIQHDAPGTNEVFEYAITDVPSAVEALYEEMGMKVISGAEASGEECKVGFSFYMFMIWEGKSIFHEDGTICREFSQLNLEGAFDFIDIEKTEPISIPMNDMYEFSDDYVECDKSKEPPYNLLWPKAILEVFNQLYGETALKAALKIPALESAAAELLNK